VSVPARVSMTARLTVLFVLVSTSVLLVLGFVVAAAVEKHFEEQDKEVLIGKMGLVQHTLEKLRSMGDLDGVMQSLDDALVGHHGLDVMVVGADQQLLFSSTQHPFALDLVRGTASRSPMQPTLWLRDGQHYRGIAAPVATGLADGLPVTVAVAIDIVHHQEFMQSFQRTLWAFIAAAAALAGVLGWAAARHGLAPLRNMREQTNAVTAQHLSYRLPVQAMPVELSQLAQSLNDMLSRLEAAFGRLTAFSSDIAHELRTPVSNLMTETQVALSRERSTAEYQRILESNAEEFDHLGRMIADMLLLAKADNGLFIPNLQTLQLASEVRALFDYYDAVADEKGVKFTLEGDGTLGADRLMLRRALGNLLSNAIRHATPHTAVEVSIQAGVKSIEICVLNTGDAIAPEHLERVFERFFRVDPSRQISSEGTGLGLAITKSIVAAHGGTITVTSSDKDTVFRVFLPR
jgi:two-component system heavy metal sensor histidine kinase CusS